MFYFKLFDRFQKRKIKTVLPLGQNALLKEQDKKRTKTFFSWFTKTYNLKKRHVALIVFSFVT